MSKVRPIIFIGPQCILDGSIMVSLRLHYVPAAELRIPFKKTVRPYAIGPLSTAFASDPLDRCLSVCLSVCLSCHVLSVTLVYCGQTVGRIQMKLGTQVGLGGSARATLR